MKKDLVVDIRARLSVEEVVGSYLSLRRSGESYKALSPFKNEKTPSLIVTPAKEIWKDFSSGKGGDIFSFIMEYEGVDFKEALNILAQKAGLDPAEYRAQPAREPGQPDLRKEALAVLESATEFYCQQFKNSAVAKSYVQKRDFTGRAAADFRFGYAPADWESLWKHLQDIKVPLRYAALAGLIKKRPVPAWLARRQPTAAKERWGDFFAGRLMIPLSDPQGRVIGFTGRLLAEKEGIAKYVNSKQTILYNKSRHVFGYFQAREAIREKGFVIVVEGNLDVVACHQAGMRQTVAAGGTALTVDHLKIIGRLTKDVRLAFDGDAAGTAAMERSLAAAQEAAVNLSIISLPPDNDPDDLIKREPKLWRQLVGRPKPAPEWLMQKYLADLDLGTAAGKKALTDVMLPVIECLTDEVEKDHYLSKMEELGISRSALEKKLQFISGRQAPPPPVPKNPAGHNPASVLPPATRYRGSKLQLLLGLLLIESQLRSVFTEEETGRLEVISSRQAPAAKLYGFLRQNDQAINSSKDLPSVQRRLFGEYADAALSLAKEVENGLYASCELSIKQEAARELFQQLDVLQARAERVK